MCYDPLMPTIAQRDLRNRSGEILREAERGTSFVVHLPRAERQADGAVPEAAETTEPAENARRA